MPTTQTWNPNPNVAGDDTLDPAHYVDGASFLPGDTLVVNAGFPGAASLSDGLAALISGAFIFNETGGANEDLDFGTSQSMEHPR